MAAGDGEMKGRLRAADHTWLLRLADPQAGVLEGGPEADALPALLEASSYHRVLPTVLANLPSPLRSAIPNSYRNALVVDGAQVAILRRFGIQLLDALGAAGVPATVVKGEGFARRLYASVGWRPYTDIDLLTRPADFARAGEVIERLGFERVSAPVKRDSGYAEEKWRLEHQGVEVMAELHWDVVNSPTLRQRHHLAFDDVVGDGREPDTIGDLLVACTHGTLGHMFTRLYQLVDVLQTARRVKETVDVDELAARAERCGLRNVVRFALAVAGNLFAEPSCSELAERAGLGMPPLRIERLLTARAILSPRGSGDPLTSWRRPLLREWLKRS